MSETVVWSCGAGRNSYAVAVGLVERGLSYDLAMFADTGAEKKKTYEALEILQEYLRAHGLPPVMTVWKKNQDMTRAKTLEQDCLDRKALPGIVYGRKSCSDHYKIRPQDEIVDNWQPALEAWGRDEKVVKWIGFHADESHRTFNYDGNKYIVRYPLIEWNWGQEECEAAILRAGLPMPPKSSCFFCPNMREHEIIQLDREEPELAERAIRMERNAVMQGELKGLGRRYRWADVIEADRNQVKVDFGDPPEISCACIS